jgi:hypothetical protein
MPIEKYLLPEEKIIFWSDFNVNYNEEEYRVYITSHRLVLFKETGVIPPPAPKGGAVPAKETKPGTRPSKVRPVASGDRLYAIADGQLVALDAATGGQSAA